MSPSRAARSPERRRSPFSGVWLPRKTPGTCLDRFSIFGACASCPSRALNLQYRILLLLMTLEEAIWGQPEWVFQTRGRTRVLQPACRRWLPAEWTWLVYLSVPSSLNYHTGSCLLSLISNLLPLRLSGTCHIQAQCKGTVMKAQSLPSGSSESVSLCVSGGACELRAAPGSSPKALHLGLVLLVLEGSEKMGGAGQCSLEGTPGKWNSPALPGRTSGVSDHVATQPGRGRGLLGPGSAGLCGAVWSHRPKGAGLWDGFAF